MICKTYDDLSLPEKFSFIGKIIHLIQNDEEICKSALSTVRAAEQRGLLDNVTILPSNTAGTTNEPNDRTFIENLD